MTITTLRTLESLYTRDDEQLDEREAGQLIDAAHHDGVVDANERTALKTVSKPTKEATSVIERFLATAAPEPLLRPLPGFDRTSLDDDAVLLTADGTARGTAGVIPHSRGWGAVKTGPMRLHHGSVAPSSSVLSKAELEAVRAKTPGQALDAAARELGAPLGAGFEALAWKSSSFDETAPHWWGKCHAWAWAALSSELSARVDVGGPEGERGLWLGGQWVSRADLGNFLMGVTDRVALEDDTELFDAVVSPMDLLQATAQHLLSGGGGFVADVHHDATHGGAREVWNQPFVGADVTVTSLSSESTRALLELAQTHGVPAAAAKRIDLTGRYGNETSDAWEGAWGEGRRRWNVYAVTDENGVVQMAWWANDKALDAVPGLPTRESAEPLEYVWRPSLAPITAGLKNQPDPVLDGDVLKHELRFFLGTVLTRGVPGAVRSRFEAEVAKLPAGPIDAKVAAALHGRFPGIADAYTKDQWARSFGQRGL